MTMIQNVKSILTKYPLLRGMLSYSVIWPTSALIQQTIAGKTWGMKPKNFYCYHFIINISFPY